jgi:hypothetical protein
MAKGDGVVGETEIDPDQLPAAAVSLVEGHPAEEYH